jgi:hypothetical protein
LALTSPTSGGRSVGIVPLRTKTTEFFLFVGNAEGEKLFGRGGLGEDSNNKKIGYDNAGQSELAQERIHC